jgi:hypothetical protein
MAQPNDVERSAGPNETAANSPETPAAINVAVVYQDPPSRAWAEAICNRVARLVSPETINPTWWEIEQLRNAAVLTNAVEASLNSQPRPGMSAGSAITYRFTPDK